MQTTRRRLLAGSAAAAGLAALGMPAIAQQRTKIRIGYLHTLAVDGQMWLAQHLDAWGKNGLEPEFKQFTTGLELFQAMVGGSLDMLSTGAVISNFPARGQGRMFIANCVEFATAQLWVREDQGSRASPTSRASGSPPPPAPRRTSSSTPRCAPTASGAATSRS